MRRSALHSLARPSWTICCFYEAGHVPPPPPYLCIFFLPSTVRRAHIQASEPRSLPLCTGLSSPPHPRFSSKVKQDGPVFSWHSVHSSVTAPVPPHYSCTFPQLLLPRGTASPAASLAGTAPGTQLRFHEHLLKSNSSDFLNSYKPGPAPHGSARAGSTLVVCSLLDPPPSNSTAFSLFSHLTLGRVSLENQI